MTCGINFLGAGNSSDSRTWTPYISVNLSQNTLTNVVASKIVVSVILPF